MEVFTIFLSSLIAVISPLGLVVDSVVANQLRSQVKSVEKLAVRVDNTPSYQPIAGKIDRIRIASRGVEVIENLRIDTLDLETDPIDINISKIQNLEGIKSIQSSLNKPFQGGIRLVIKEQDLNLALEAYSIREQLQALLDTVLPPEAPSFNILKLQLNFMAENRLALEIELEQPGEEGEPPIELAIAAEVGFEIDQGKNIKLKDLSAIINDRKISSRFANILLAGISDRLSLDIFADQGFLVRILQVNMDENTLDIAAFFRLDTVQDNQ
ncbi:LmeA family phospholipid-binding protein [Crocosphaera sp. Alani8]|uniref:LmeA family phospholipid-binding protein n=1 Tax=Crocosphaera sp. Alani8 TaxID=3038952 RepID=UPI00313BB53D